MFSQFKLYAFLATVVVLLGLGFYGGYRWEVSVVDDLKLKYEEASTKAISEALNKQNLENQKAVQAAQQESVKQKQIADKTKSQLNNVEKFVKNYKCITYGLLKTLNTAAISTYVALPLPANKTDFDCAPIDTVLLSKNIITNYGIANANSQQLNSLIAYLQKLQDTQRHSDKK